MSVDGNREIADENDFPASAVRQAVSELREQRHFCAESFRYQDGRRVAFELVARTDCEL